MNVIKAVIPVAGMGTRMLPAAKAVPKELLPILDRPCLQYVLEEAADAGLSDVLLISSKDKRAIEDHFDPNPELEARLAASGKAELLASVIALAQKINIQTVRQSVQRGLGDAVNHARRFCGDQPFAVMLGDTIFSGGQSPAHQLREVAMRYNTAVIGLEEVPLEKVERYGIAGGTMIEPGVMRIETLVEKPPRDAAPSRLAIAARYILTPTIFACLDQTKPGKGGEIQLTDALQLMLKREPMHGVVLSSHRHDIGNPVDWLKTNLIYAAARPDLWSQLQPLLKSLMK